MFSKVSDSWWNPNGAFKILHRIHALRMYWLDLSPCLGQKILDIGCGGGLISESLSRLNHNVIGLDKNTKSIKEAKHHASMMGLKITYIAQSFEDFSYHEPFDAIVAFEVIEHVSNPMDFLEKCALLLKPKGTLYLSTINRTLLSYFLLIVGAEYILNWIPKGTHNWHQFLSPKEITDMLSTHGLQTTNIKGMTYRCLLRSFQLSDSLTSNFFLKATKDVSK